MSRSTGLRPRPLRALALLGLALALSAGSVEGQGPLDGLRRGMQSQAAFTKGQALYDRHDYRGARDQFVMAVTLDPAHDEAMALLGWCQFFLGEYRAAGITFKAALRRQPSWSGLHDGLGWSRLRLKRYHLATEAFQDALDLDPDYSDALIGLGSAQFELGRYEEALGPLEKGLRRTTLFRAAGQELPEARARLAWTLYYLGRYDAALAAFGEALRAAPDGHGLYNGMGWTYLRLGRKMEAQAAFRRALALQPDYEDAREGLRQASG